MLADAPAKSLRVVEIIGEMSGIAEQLFRDASGIDASPAQVGRFDDRDLGTTLGREATGPDAARACADGDKVEDLIHVIYARCEK